MGNLFQDAKFCRKWNKWDGPALANWTQLSNASRPFEVWGGCAWPSHASEGLQERHFWKALCFFGKLEVSFRSVREISEALQLWAWCPCIFKSRVPSPWVRRAYFSALLNAHSRPYSSEFHPVCHSTLVWHEWLTSQFLGGPLGEVHLSLAELSCQMSKKWCAFTVLTSCQCAVRWTGWKLLPYRIFGSQL